MMHRLFTWPNRPRDVFVCVWGGGRLSGGSEAFLVSQEGRWGQCVCAEFTCVWKRGRGGRDFDSCVLGMCSHPNHFAVIFISALDSVRLPLAKRNLLESDVLMKRTANRPLGGGGATAFALNMPRWGDTCGTNVW